MDDAKHRAFFIVLSVLPVAVLAGIRDDSIGTDVLVYGKACFLDVYQSRWYSEIDLSWMIRMEPGYLMLNYVVSRFTGDYHIFFGILMALQMFFVMKFLLCFKNRLPVWLGLAAYYFSYYNVSLNQMRQSMACAIVLYACTFVYKRKFIRFAALIGFASLFHISAALAILIYPVYMIFKKKRSYALMFFFVALGVVMSLLVQRSIDAVLATLGLNADYAHYFKDSTKGFFFTKFLITLPMPFLFFLYRKRFYRTETVYLAFSLVVMVVATQARELIGNDAERIMNYFVMTQILVLPFICAHLSSAKRKVVAILGLLYYIGYWFYFFIYNGFQETYPYTSYILKQWI